MNIATIADEARSRIDEPGAIVYVAGDGPDVEHSTDVLHADGVRFAGALGQLGVGPGDRVAVLVPNCPEIGSAYHGILRMGGVVLPILFLLAPSEVRHILADSGAVAVVTTPEFLPVVRQASEGLEHVRHVIVVGEPGDGGSKSFRELVQAAPESSAIVDRSADDLALLLYTGGTTGRPKGVMLSHGNLDFSAGAAAKVTVDNLRAFGLEPGETTAISALPLAHAYGVIVSLVGPKIQELTGARRGGRSVLLKWFDPEHYFRCIEEYRCTTSPMVPTMMAYLLDHPAAARYDASSLVLVSSAASPLPVELLRAFESRFGCTVLESYGLTESAPIATSNRADRRKIGSVGIAYPGVGVEIRDTVSDDALGAGQPGEVCIRGPNVMLGYWNLPDETSRAIRDGVLHTGDVGYLDEEGFLFIVDRVKNLIIRGGLNVYPRDVEEVLHRHDAVLEAAVIGVPDAAYGEEVEAFVVLKAGAEATEDVLLEHCRGSLAKYKSPKAIHFVDTLPKSGVGKILHRQLREEALRRRPARQDARG